MLQFLDFDEFLSLTCSRKMMLMMLMVVVQLLRGLLATKWNVGSKFIASSNLTLELPSCGWNPSTLLLTLSVLLCPTSTLCSCLNDISTQFYLLQLLDMPLPHQ